MYLYKKISQRAPKISHKEHKGTKITKPLISLGVLGFLVSFV